MSQRTAFTGSTLVRLLARLTQVDASESPQVFTEQLGQWIGWAEAIPLSAALNGAVHPAPAEGVWLPDEAHAARVLAGLENEVAEDGRPAVRRPRQSAVRGVVIPVQPPDFGTWRRRYQTRQVSFDNTIAPLRAQLRATLAGASPKLAQLAAVDAVMDRVHALQERQWLAGLPSLLEKHFERLRQAAEADATTATAQGDEPAWVQRFGQDMQHLLRAELEFRWQPVEGLLAALRSTKQQDLS